VGFIGVRHVVDGQQRLTTLQLLLDAARWVVEQRGTSIDAQGLQVLVLNNPAIAQHPDEIFKVWPTDRDQHAFRAAMTGASVPAALVGSRIAQAHAFFIEQITDWAATAGDQDAAPTRLNALVRALRDHLKLVVIDLEPRPSSRRSWPNVRYSSRRMGGAWNSRGFRLPELAGLLTMQRETSRTNDAMTNTSTGSSTAGNVSAAL
jgi:hypothetical protein